MKKLFFFVIVLIVMLFSASLVFAADIYIKAGVNDGDGSGTLDDPYSSGDGFAAVEEEGIIYALSGTYDTPDLIMVKPNTQLLSAPENEEAPNFTVGLTIYADGISIKGIVFDISSNDNVNAFAIKVNDNVNDTVSNTVIENNSFNCPGTAIVMPNASMTTINDNTFSKEITDSPVGIGIEYRSGDVLNAFNNTFNNNIGIILCGDVADIHDNTFTYGNGISVMHGSMSKIRDNHFSKCNAGVLIDNHFDKSISIFNNLFEQSYGGIAFDASEGSLYADGNNFNAGDIGIYLLNGKTVDIRNNSFDNAARGIYVHNESEEVWQTALYIDNNTFNVNKDYTIMGIDFKVTKDIGRFLNPINITNNTIDITATETGNNAYGIHFESTYGSIYADINSNTINVVSDETAFGFYFDAGKSVISEIYNNDFDVSGGDDNFLDRNFPAEAFCTFITCKMIGNNSINSADRKPTIFSGNTGRLSRKFREDVPLEEYANSWEIPLYLESGNVTTLVDGNPSGGGNYVDLISYGLNDIVVETTSLMRNIFQEIFRFTRDIFRPRPKSIPGFISKWHYTGAFPYEAWMNFGIPTYPQPNWYGLGTGYDYITPLPYGTGYDFNTPPYDTEFDYNPPLP